MYVCYASSFLPSSAANCFIVQFLTEMITNNAAAALCIPIVMEGAAEIGVNPQPFYLAVMLAVGFHCCCFVHVSFACPDPELLILWCISLLPYCHF